MKLSFWNFSFLSQLDPYPMHVIILALHLQDDIWLPDTYFIMHGEFKENLSKDKIALKIYKDGKVSYTMR